MARVRLPGGLQMALGTLQTASWQGPGYPPDSVMAGSRVPPGHPTSTALGTSRYPTSTALGTSWYTLGTGTSWHTLGTGTSWYPEYYQVP